MSEIVTIAPPVEQQINNTEIVSLTDAENVGSVALSTLVELDRNSILQASEEAFVAQGTSLDAQIEAGFKSTGNESLATDTVFVNGADGQAEKLPITSLTKEQRAIVFEDTIDDGVAFAGIDKLSTEAARALVVARLDRVLAKSLDPRERASATERNVRLATESFWAGGDLVHATVTSSIEPILQRGLLCSDLLGENAKGDTTQLQADFNRLSREVAEETPEGRRAYMAARNGMLIRFVRSDQATDYRQEGSGNMDTDHVTIIVGLPSTEIGGIMLDNPADLRMLALSIAQSGIYIPVYDQTDQLIFAPEDFEARVKALSEQPKQIVSDMDLSQDRPVTRVLTSDRTVDQILRSLAKIEGSTHGIFANLQLKGVLVGTHQGTSGDVKLRGIDRTEGTADSAIITEEDSQSRTTLFVDRDTGQEAPGVDVEIIGNLQDGGPPTEKSVRSLVARRLLVLRREMHAAKRAELESVPATRPTRG